jgi:hypothetical protein
MYTSHILLKLVVEYAKSVFFKHQLYTIIGSISEIIDFEV